MGGCLTLSREEAGARRRSEEIDRQLAALAEQEFKHIKILLLGIYIYIYFLNNIIKFNITENSYESQRLFSIDQN